MKTGKFFVIPSLRLNKYLVTHRIALFAVEPSFISFRFVNEMQSRVTALIRSNTGEDCLAFVNVPNETEMIDA